MKSYQYLIHRIKLAIPIIQLFPSYLKDSLIHQIIPLKKSDKRIIFTLDDEFLYRNDGGFGREAFYVLNTFSEGGYNVYFYRPSDFRSYWRLGFLGRLIYRIENLRFVSKLPVDTKNFIYAFDAIRPDFLKLSWKRLVHVNIKKSATCTIGNLIPMQFYMIPFIYAFGLDKKLVQYRNLKRKYRIFFGGSLNAVYYDSPFFKNKYPHLMTRLEGVRAVRGSEIDNWFIDNEEDLSKLINNKTYFNGLIIVEIKTSFPIQSKDWLKFLGQSDFFMCFSGTDYPICHNSVEAMAVGSIPILAYADWFWPPLEHGKNAIVYTDKEDMIKKIKLVMNMSQEEIQRLRKGVLEYYDQYFSKGHMARTYESQAKSISTMTLFPKIVSDEKDDIKAKEFMVNFENLNIEEKIIK